jgi:hypothetical protein
LKLIIKLAIVALLANAVWRVGSVYAAYYRFTDAVQQTTLYRGEKTDNQIRDRVFELASDYDIPVNDETLTVRRENNHTIVEGAYRKPVQLFPGFSYDVKFDVHVDTFTLTGLK